MWTHLLVNSKRITRKLFTQYNVYHTLYETFENYVENFNLRGLYFRVNSREHIDAKINSSPIILM